MTSCADAGTRSMTDDAGKHSERNAYRAAAERLRSVHRHAKWSRPAFRPESVCVSSHLNVGSCLGLALTISLLSGVGACTPRPQVMTTCRNNSQCEVGLVCRLGICTQVCSIDRDCIDPANPATRSLRCVDDATTGGRACLMPNDAGFTDAGDSGTPDGPSDAVAPVDVPPDTCPSFDARVRPPDGGCPGCVTALSVANQATCALLADGTARCWGNNAAGLLGDGTEANRSVPGLVVADAIGTALMGITEVSTSGYYSSCFVLVDGSVRCVGDNSAGQLGDGTTVGRSVAVAVRALSEAKHIAVGAGHACAIRGMRNEVVCWGRNSRGQLGRGNADPPMMTLPHPDPLGVDVAGGGLLEGATQVCAGLDFACALAGTGSVLCWGANARGQIGNGTTADQPRAVPVVNAPRGMVARLTCGAAHACVLLADGTVRCWGDNSSDRLGAALAGDVTSASVMLSGPGMPPLSGARQLGLGGHNCVVMLDATVRCLGPNGWDELGDGTATARSYPSPVPCLVGVEEMGTGHGHSCARMADGSVMCWGRGALGQLGTGSTGDTSVPRRVVGLPAS